MMFEHLKGDPRAEAGRRLYNGPGGEGHSYDHALTSAYSPRLVAARSRRDHVEVKRLEAEQRELGAMMREMQLSAASALRLANAIRDCSIKPRTRTQMTEHDQLAMQQRYGERTQEVIDAAATQVTNKFLSTKPTLLETVNRTHAYVHPDVVEIAADTAIAHGLVKQET